MMTTVTKTKRPPSADAHFDDFARLRRAGYSYNEIAQRYSLSHERVRQVLWRNDTTGEFHRSAPRYKRQQQIEEITAFLEANGPIDRNTVLERFGITSNRLNSLISSGVPSHLIMTTARDMPVTFTAERVSEALRIAWAELLVVNPDATGLSHVMYERLRRADDPSSPLVVGRYGWANACDRAGVPSGSTWRGSVGYGSKWSDEDIIHTVAEFAAECRKERVRPSYLAYERFQQMSSERPSGSLVRNRMRRLGVTTWPNIVRTAAFAARAK